MPYPAAFMNFPHIAALLRPFLGGGELSEQQIYRITIYIDLLQRWNARINLTAVRDPEEIVTRHFGESFFAARHLLDHAPQAPNNISPIARIGGFHIHDIGSGAGFPGIPLKIWAPDVRLTLIESQNKKATFLKEVVRSLELADAEVVSIRAEAHDQPADLVTLRAVERFQEVLPVAAGLVKSGGRLALLIGSAQVNHARQQSGLKWNKPIAIPRSRTRVLLIGTNQATKESEP